MTSTDSVHRSVEIATDPGDTWELLVDDETLQAIWAVRKRLADLPHDEAARTIASDLEGTLDNATYLAGAGGSSTR